MIKIVEKGKSQSNLKVAEESIIASLNGFDNSHYILSSPDDAHILVSALRKFVGKTGQEVANQVDIKQETISAYENGKRKMNFAVLESLVSTLGYRFSICIEKIGEESEANTIELMPDELTYNFSEHFKK